MIILGRHIIRFFKTKFQTHLTNLEITLISHLVMILFLAAAHREASPPLMKLRKRWKIEESEK